MHPHEFAELKVLPGPRRPPKDGAVDESLRIGARVRIRRSIVPGVPELQDEGEVVRIDARGVLVRLDSGGEVLTEPAVLAVVA